MCFYVLYFCAVFVDCVSVYWRFRVRVLRFAFQVQCCALQSRVLVCAGAVPFVFRSVIVIGQVGHCDCEVGCWEGNRK